MRRVHELTGRLTKQVRARGEPAADDMSIAAHLLRIRDPQTGEMQGLGLRLGGWGTWHSQVGLARSSAGRAACFRAEETACGA